MNYCLNKTSLEQFLKFVSDKATHPIEDENLIAIIEGASAWDCKVTLITYFFTTYLQRKINGGKLDGAEISVYYQLLESGNYDYQEFNRDFISYLFDYSRSKMNMTLEEILVNVQQDYSENNYASAFRY